MKSTKKIRGRIWLLCFSLIFSFICVRAQEYEPEKLFKMSLEELMKLEIDAGTLTRTSLSKVPVSITTITSEEIKYTPARNIYDLIEVYVPGALWMNHNEGPHIGLRGIIVDRNYKFLLLVNGRNLNQKAHNGAISELENWDLNDIEKIEIIRGPGSVTYGPGAIMAVINIVTKDARTAEGTKLNTNYISSYSSRGVNISHGLRNDYFDFYIYGSFVKTEGYTPIAFVVDKDNNMAGYVGKDFNTGRFKNPPLDYFKDFDDKPQIKTYMELQFFKEWTLSARYTNSGTSNLGVSTSGYNTKVRFQTGFSLDSITTEPSGEIIYHRSPTFGKLDNFRMNQIRHFVVSMENNHHFRDLFNLKHGLHLKTMISWDSHDYERRAVLSGFENYRFTDPIEIQQAISDRNSVRYKMINFAENEFFTKLLANIRFKDKYRVALGFEYSYDYYRPGWGDDERDFRMGDQHDIISDSTSNAYGYKQYGGETSETVCFVGNGWSMHTFSYLGELSFDFHPLLKLYLSARSDQNSYSRLLFSPRIAVVSELSKGNYIKLIWQQSERMNTASQLFLQNRAGKKSDPETLSGYEFIYTRLQSNEFLFSISGFYNELQILAWSNEDNNTRLKGDLSLLGFEIETKYSLKKVIIGLNHSYVKQVDWKLATFEKTSGISYSDYREEVDGGIILTGTGNDLNNWSNHATKFFTRFNLFDNKLILHANARAFWNFEGAKDGLIMLQKAVAGSDKESEVNEAIAVVNSHNTYDLDFRFNFSATLQVNNNLSVMAFVMNLAGIGDNKRYAYDAGIKMASPHRVAFVEEPRVFGIRLNAKF